jgi:outer membrane protein assembly factor BamB
MKECLLWKQPCDYPFSLVLSGDVLFTGGRNRVGAFDAQSGKLLWNGAVQGRALGLASIQAHFYVSTDLGLVYAFKAAPQQASLR